MHHLRNLWKRCVERIDWSHSAEHDSIARWRAVMLASILVSGLAFGIFAFIAAAGLIFKENAWGLAVSDTTGLILCITFLFVRKIRFEIRAVITLFMFYIIGLSVIVSVGPLSGGPVWLFSFAILVGVLIGNNAALGAVVLNAVTLGVVGFMISSGIIGEDFPFFKSSQALIAAWVNFTMLNAITAVSVSALVRGVFRLLKRQEDLARGLEEERRQLLKTQEALTLEINERNHTEGINRTLFAISNAVNTTKNLPDLFRRIHHLLGEIIDVTNFFIVIVDMEKRILHFPYHVDTRDDDFSSIEEFDAGDSLSGMVVSRCRALLLRQEELLERAEKGGIWGPVPLIWMGERLSEPGLSPMTSRNGKKSNPWSFNRKK